MSRIDKKIRIKIGIDGAKGKEAGEAMYALIREKDNANTDQSAVNVMLGGDPQTPDRTWAIQKLKGNPSITLDDIDNPALYIADSIEEMESAGCHMFVIPCNTAHYFFDEIQRELPQTPIVNMLKVTSDAICLKNPNAKIGILATDGTVGSGMYEDHLNQAGFTDILTPSPNYQKAVMNAIYGVETGVIDKNDHIVRHPNGIKSMEKELPSKFLIEASKELIENGTDTIILGCTEISLVKRQLADAFPNVDFIDPMEVTADFMVKTAKDVQENIDEMIFAKQPVRNEAVRKMFFNVINPQEAIYNIIQENVPERRTAMSM
ncbi:MAG: aspartate/glutamate racemase family protein [Alphaproteobacteria bacterium]|nr:aspartate/glutamate racemase family protein [Alphaproteobacteria bacterium]